MKTGNMQAENNVAGDVVMILGFWPLNLSASSTVAVLTHGQV